MTSRSRHAGGRGFAAILFGAIAIAVGLPDVASARTVCSERVVRRFVERTRPDWASLVSIDRVRGERGARVRLGEPRFGEPAYGALLRPGCTAVAVSYRVDVELESARGGTVYYAPRTVWGRAVFVLRGGELRLVAKRQDAASADAARLERRMLVRNVDRSPTDEIVEVVEAVHRPELVAFRVHGGRLRPVGTRLERPEAVVQLAAIETRGPLPTSAVRSALLPHVGRFERCIESQALASGEPLVSRTLELVLDSRGRLATARPGPGQRSIEFMDACVRELAGSLRVPGDGAAGAAGTTEARLPLVMRGA